MNVAEQILDLARWAPSGDNVQPWRFEVGSDERVVVHAFNTHRFGVYDLDSRASQVSMGALLETIRIAASAHGRTARIVRRTDAAPELPVFDVEFERVPGLAVDPLHTFIRERSVQRKPLSALPLDPAAKAQLERAVAPGYSVVWFEGWRQRMRLAWLTVRSAKIRLTIPEAYAVHREIIEWNARYSETRIPDQALGADPITVRFMHWVLADWSRVRMMNRYFGGTLTPRLQLDLIPGLRCAAHFALVAHRAPVDADDHVAAGAAVQRFWLTSTSLKLQLQPNYAPLAFASYVRRGLPFTEVRSATRRAEDVVHMLSRLLGSATAEATVFLGRIGSGPAATARSLRLPLERLRWIDPARGDQSSLRADVVRRHCPGCCRDRPAPTTSAALTSVSVAAAAAKRPSVRFAIALP